MPFLDPSPVAIFNASPIKEFRVQTHIHLRFDDRYPGWRQSLDELKAAVPPMYRQHGPGDWIVIELRCSPEVLTLIQKWGVDLPEWTLKHLKGASAIELRARDVAPPEAAGAAKG